MRIFGSGNSFARPLHLCATIFFLVLIYIGLGGWKGDGSGKHTLPNLAGSKRPRCWIFSHMPKSGGSTVREQLKARWGKKKFRKYGSPEWKYGEKKALNVLDKGSGYRVYAGSMTEVLRRYGGERCIWFTMFRHPIPRVVSAFYYCKNVPGDPLCATSIMRATRVDLVTFAKHWGNFGLRLFALSRINPNEVMRVAREKDRSASGWYLVRRYMEGRYTGPKLGPDSALNGTLEFAKELLDTKYAAVGLLENFTPTMQLYDRTLGMPGRGWPWWAKVLGRRNVNKAFKRQEEQALEKAWKDPRIARFVQLDLLLYEHAKKVHYRQLAEYGLA